MQALPNDTAASILVVVDEPSARTPLIQAFKPFFHIHAARSAREAVWKARMERPDLIVSDLGVPEANGFMLIEALREDAATRDIPFVMLADRAAAAAGAGREMGITLLVEKPVDIQDLLARLQHLIHC